MGRGSSCKKLPASVRPSFVFMCVFSVSQLVVTGTLTVLLVLQIDGFIVIES